MRREMPQATCTILLAAGKDDPALVNELHSHYQLGMRACARPVPRAASAETDMRPPVLVVLPVRTLTACIQSLRALAGNNSTAVLLLDLDNPPSTTVKGSPELSTLSLLKQIQAEVALARSATAIGAPARRARSLLSSHTAASHAVITSTLDEDLSLRALQAGAHDVYLKPLSPQLISTLYLAAAKRRFSQRTPSSSDLTELDANRPSSTLHVSASDRCERSSDAAFVPQLCSHA